MKNLSKNSVKLVQLFEKNYEKSQETMFNVVLDYIQTRNEFKISHPEAYELYQAAGLVNLTQSSFANRVNWNYGTLEDFKKLGAKEYTKFCSAKKKDAKVTTESYTKVDDKKETSPTVGAESKELRVDNNYAKFQQTHTYKTVAGMTIEELEDIQKYIAVMIDEARTAEAAPKK